MKQLYFLLLLLFPTFFQAQVTLNEASNSNGTTVVDADGSSPDWIELYNTTSASIDLTGYGLSDRSGEPMKWIFPEYQLPASGFLVVLASGKGTLQATVDHYETAVMPADSWQYTIPSSNLPANWNAIGFNTTGWTTAPLGIGFGDGDDVTDIVGPATSVYVRREFTIADTSKIMKAFFDADFDDGFVAYLNGIEIARFGLTGFPPNWDDFSADHEATIYQGGAPVSYTVDPVTLAAAMRNGTNVLAIEVHNLNAGSSDLSLIPFLTFGFEDAATYYGGTVHNWFSATPGTNYLHTNFSINTGGETLYLYDPSGTLLDSLVVPDLEADMSYGKQVDGNPAHYIFDTPTPDATNNSSVSYAGMEYTPVIDVSGGFYTSTVSVTVTNQSQTGGFIRYTTTGETPDIGSPLFPGSLTLSANTVLKVRCFSPSGTLLPSLTATETYLFMEDFTLPVISISTDNANLYGPSGIFDNYTTDWRRPCVIEYFDANGQKQFASRASIKPDGGAGGSRSNPQHSVTIEPAHGVYGEGEPVEYPLIPEKSFIHEYSAFYLRNGSNYWNQYPQKDATFMRIMRESHANSQAYSPVIAYVNGQYFGVYELREKANEAYFETNYGNNPDSLDLLSVSYFYGAGVLRTVKGSDDSFYAMHDFVGTYSAAAPDYFEQCHKQIDLYNFADYLAGENWFANFDWVYNNMKIARMQTAGNKWKFYLQDMELGLGGWGNYDANMFDYFRYNNQPNAYWDIYNSLVQNTQFRNYFVNRYADLMNTTFQPDYYTPIVNAMYNQLLPELPRHLQLWTGDVVGGMANYMNIRNDLLNNQFANRNDVVRNQILTEFALNETVDVTLDVSPPGAGYIKISTIVPETLPWTGVYFDGVPVKITAVANPGYTFTAWQANTVIPATSLDSASIQLNIPNDDGFTALFSGSAAPLSLTISEINYNSDPSVSGGNWIELHNYGATPLHLDEWSVKTKHFWEAYTFPPQTVIPADGYLVVCEDTNQFKALYPAVTNFIGSTVFDWSNSDDSIKLYDPYHHIVLQTIYTDEAPFPLCADGWGRTLENQYTQSAQLDSTSWFCGCVKGSPGTAYFPCDEPVHFTEISYNSISASYSAGDWVEVKNNTASPMALAGYVFKDSKDDHLFTFPAITLPPGGYWVVSADSVLFANRHPEVENFSGTFDFGLGDDDGLRLYDNQGILVTSMIYNSVDPWPVSPSVSDYTLEYAGAQEYVDPNDPASWFAGCEGGSPGRAFMNCPALPEGEDVGVYPNPATSMLNVVYNNANNSSNTTDLELFDLSGNIVRRFSVSAIEQVVKVEIDVHALANGMYFIRVVQDGRVKQVPFVKI
jgi:hypothetical protein